LIGGNQNLFLFDIPEQGVAEGLKPSLTVLATDKRLLNFSEFHPFAEGVYITNASDKSVSTSAWEKKLQKSSNQWLS
jgi:hypothetical protein